MAKVSVVIPNYNCGPYISKAIESILSQTYQNFEVLICDDGSTDNSVLVIKEWQKKDSRIKLFVNDINRGNIYCYNKLFFVAEGEYIMIQDADDWSHPQRIEKQLAIINANGVDICLTNFIEYKLDGVINSQPPASYSGLISVDDESRWGAPATMVFKKEILDTVPGFNTYFERLTVMDRYFLLEVLSTYKGYYLDEYLYYVLARPNSDHRGINLKDKNGLRKLAIQGVFKKLKQQRIETGTDWLKDKKLDQIQAYEQKLINNRGYIAEALRGMAIKQIECNGFRNASKLLKAAIKKAPFHFDTYRTLFYYLRALKRT